MPPAYATRRELMALSARVDQIDIGGTRGMVGVQVQVGELIKDLAELRVKLEEHEKNHQREAQVRADERRESRRYAITTIIAAVATLVAVIALLATRLH